MAIVRERVISERFEKIKKIVSSVVGKFFPSCAVVAGDSTGKYYEFYWNSKENSLFDIASLTKPIVGTTICLELKLSDEKIYMYLPEPKKDSELKREISVEDILSHKAGFCSHIPLFEKAKDRNSAMQLAWDEKLCYKPREKCEYSDMGFICLTFFIERKTGKRLKENFHKIKKEIGMKRTIFFSEVSENNIADIIPTTSEIRVHDENAHIMEGESLHAGLLSTANEIAEFSKWMIKKYKNKFIKEGIERIKAGNRFFLGFDTFIKGFTIKDGSEIEEILKLEKEKIEEKILFGHLGFTGCGFWINFTREEFLVFLSNRVYPSVGKYPEQTPSEFSAIRKKIWEEFSS